MSSTAEHIESLSIPEPNSGCWLWLGPLMGVGYGRLSRRAGLGQWAHRASYKVFVGEIPERMHVLHRCDVRCCVNPDHLFLGTQLENMRDMHAKKRNGGRGAAPGENHHNAKLTERDVLAIRAAPGTVRKIGERFGVSGGTISKIKTMKKWKGT